MLRDEEPDYVESLIKTTSESKDVNEYPLSTSISLVSSIAVCIFECNKETNFNLFKYYIQSLF